MQHGASYVYTTEPLKDSVDIILNKFHRMKFGVWLDKTCFNMFKSAPNKVSQRVCNTFSLISL